MIHRRPTKILLLLAIAIASAGCATTQPPDATGPRGSESVYPLLYIADDTRRNAATAALRRMGQTVNAETGLSLQPITLTIETAGPLSGQPLYLPKLGTAAVMTEEETRESLRRFIREWQDLIGADPTKLSLVERVDQPDGTKLASYDHRPFRYPIRGNFGRLQIRFTTDRRVVSMTSTCIPDADRIQTTLARTTVKLKPEDATNQILNNAISYADAAGTQQTFKAAAATQVKPRELVTYIRASKSNPQSLEFHIAWEVEVVSAPVRRVYVDAVNSEIIAAE
ncbi:MAG: hypothetical protein AABN95_10430 [Acidobacteriota bacterium]